LAQSGREFQEIKRPSIELLADFRPPTNPGMVTGKLEAASIRRFCARVAGPAGVWMSAIAMPLMMLIAPALWNGYPLLQWDTGGYLARGTKAIACLDAAGHGSQRLWC
jgi:hypothetical protein